MAKARDLEAELHSVREELMHAFLHTLPSKEFRAELLLGVISLGLTFKRLSGERDLKERRKLMEEFEHGVTVMRRGIGMLRPPGKRETTQEPKQAAQTGGLFS